MVSTDMAIVDRGPTGGDVWLNKWRDYRRSKGREEEEGQWGIKTYYI